MKALAALFKKHGSSMKVHIVGVGGSGMSGVAHLLLDRGFRVSGSDVASGTVTRRLEEKGLVFYKGHSAKNVWGAHLLVYSSAIRGDNIERKTAVVTNILEAHRSEVLKVLMSEKKAIIVAGTHGKTTTATMLAFVLRHAGFFPSYYIGAETPVLGDNAAWGEGEHFIVEGDESDGTVANFEPVHTVVLNVEPDHLDYYKDMDEICGVFKKVMAQTSERVFYCADDKVARSLCESRRKATGFGLGEGASVRAINCVSGDFSSSFEVAVRGKARGEIRLNVPGFQNISNAVGAVAVALSLGVDFEAAQRALVEFRGARRRFEAKHMSEEFCVVDDYAHHPSEIKVTIEAARRSGRKRVLAVFQPHRYSRTEALCGEFGAALKLADEVLVTDVYAAGESPREGVSGRAVCDAVLQAGGGMASYHASLREVEREVLARVRPGDLLLVMGAGDVSKVAEGAAEKLRQFETLRGRLSGASKLLRHEPMKKHTTIKTGGAADLWLEPSNECDIVAALHFCREESLPVTVVGRGSNMVVREGGIRGVCINLKARAFSKIKVGGNRIHVGCGVPLRDVARAACKAGLSGLEFLEGIPGDLGGAVRMNAGAHGSSIFDFVARVRCMDFSGQVMEKDGKEFDAAYRSVPFFRNHLALSVELEGIPSDPKIIAERMNAMSERRWATQPKSPSAGCVFKNPPEGSAGKLIEEAGLKGVRIGGAEVSAVHGNFIVNSGGATPSDVLALVEKVKETVLKQRGIELHTEVMILGEDA